MRMNNLAMFLGATLAAAPAVAQETGFSVGGALIFGTNDLKKVTNNSLGLTVGAAYEGVISKVTVPYRVGLNIQYMPGKTDEYDLKTSLTSAQLAGDVFVQTPAEKLRFLTGLSFNKYTVKNTGSIRDATGKLIATFPVDTDKGIKLGLRVGFEYQFATHLSGELLYQLTELGSTPKVVGTEAKGSGLGKGGINPSWLQLGLRFRF